MVNSTNPICFLCGNMLIFVSQETVQPEGMRYPQTNTVYRCSNFACQEKKAAQEKPKIKKRTLFVYFHLIPSDILNIIIFVQLIGLSLFPFNQNFYIETLGLFICFIAFVISFYGRKELATNWSDAAEYQIKNEHHLITTGIYRYIRHPIYTGVAFFIIGAELVTGSWLVVPLGIVYFVIIYIQGRKEEMILNKHFGNEYTEYMKKTKMLIPGIF